MVNVIFYFTLFLLLNIILTTPNCKNGENHCSKCNPVSKLCAKCEKDIFIPDENGGCINKRKCITGNNYCYECNEEENICKICELGYFPDENGGCSYTNNCEISYQGKCLKCKNNFILIGQDKYISIERGYIYYADMHLDINEGIQICKSLDSEDLKNCKKINGLFGTCEECVEGFYLNKGEKKCTLIENCNKSSFGKCKLCNNGYYLNVFQNKCLKKNELFQNCKEALNDYNCDICDDDYYFDNNNLCISINFCENGKNGGEECEKCHSQYYLTKTGDACTKEELCYSGNRHTGICSECIEGYYLDYKDGKCKSNQEDNEYKYCKEADYGMCNKCILGYELGLDFKCSSSKFCSESENGKCISCLDNYYLGLDNMCVDVEHCIYSEDYICKECQSDYYYDQSDKTCKFAEGNFTNCKYGLESEGYCVTCKDDCYINITDYLCYNNNGKNIFHGCEISDYDNIHCYKCIEGYYLSNKNKRCSKIKGCNILDNKNKCIECEDNYCLDVLNGKCESSREVISEEKKFYYRCKRTNKYGETCEECEEGFKIKNGLCIEDAHCLEKNEDGICTQCLNNEDSSFCLNPIFGCVESFYGNCLLCNDILDFDNCSKCVDGYELDGINKCVEFEN